MADQWVFSSQNYKPTDVIISADKSTLYWTDEQNRALYKTDISSSTSQTEQLIADSNMYFPYSLTFSSADETSVFISAYYQIWKADLSSPYTLEVFAGPTSMTTGTVDGTGTDARFVQLKGMAISNDYGTLYVADRTNYALRTVTTGYFTSTESCQACDPGSESPGGNVTSCSCVGGYYRAEQVVVTPNPVAEGTTSVFAGSVQTAGFGGSTYQTPSGTSVNFNFPFDVAVMPAGDLMLVADMYNHQIRAISLTTDSVYVLAGSSSPNSGSTDGNGVSAQFSNPRGICSNSDGSFVYVADWGNAKIRKMDMSNPSSPTVSTLTGVLPSSPNDCVVTADDSSVIVAASQKILEISTSDGTVTKTYDSVASSPSINSLTMTLDESTIIYTEYNRDLLYSVNRHGTAVHTLLHNGNPDEGATGDDDINSAQGVALSKDGKTVYITSTAASSSIRKYNLETGVMSSLVTGLNTQPKGLAVDLDGLNLYASMGAYHYISKISLGPLSVTTYTGPCTSCGVNRTSLAADAGLGPAACQWDCAADMYVGTDSVTEVTANPLGVPGTVGSSTLSLAGALAFVGTDSDFIYHRNNGVVVKTQISTGNEHTVFTTEGNYWVDALAGSPAHANLIMVASRSPSKICVYDLDADTCVFTKSLSYNPGSGSVAMSPDGTAIAYKVKHSGSSASICENSISFDAENCYSISGNWAGDNGGMAFTRDGQYIIASNQASDPRVLKITRGATMTAVDIVDTATVGSPFTPRGVAVDADGYVWVVEHAAKIWKVDLSDPGGNVAWTQFATSTFSGGYAVGGTYGVAITPDDSTMYIEANSPWYVILGDITTTTTFDACLPCKPGSESPGGNATSCTCVPDYYRAAVTETTPNSDAKGLTTTPVGSGSYGSNNGVGASAEFANLEDVTIVSGGSKAVLADKNNHRLRLWDLTSNSVSTLAGSSYGYADGTGTSAQFWMPLGLCVDPLNDNMVYVIDGANKKIRTVNVNTGVVTTFMSTSNHGRDCDITNDGVLIFSDHIGDIHEVPMTGTTISKTYPNSPHNAEKLALTPDDKTIVFANDDDRNVYTINRQSEVRTLLAGSGTNANTDGTGDGASFYYPIGVAVDKDGIMVYVSTRNSVRSIVLATGVVETLAGPVGSTSTGNTDGSGSSATFNYVTGMDITPDGLYLLAAMSEGHSVRKISLGPYSVTTYTGTCTSCGENRTSVPSDAGLGPAACQWVCAVNTSVGQDSLVVSTPNPEPRGRVTSPSWGYPTELGGNVPSKTLTFVGNDNVWLYYTLNTNYNAIFRVNVNTGNVELVHQFTAFSRIRSLDGSPTNSVIAIKTDEGHYCIFDIVAKTPDCGSGISGPSGTSLAYKGGSKFTSDGNTLVYIGPNGNSVCEVDISGVNAHGGTPQCISVGYYAEYFETLAITPDDQYIIAIKTDLNKVYKITRGATMSSAFLAGSGVNSGRAAAGYVGPEGTGADADIAVPIDVVVEADGVHALIIENRAYLWKIDIATGAATILAGNCGCVSHYMNEWTAGTYNCWGGLNDGDGTSAQFSYPDALAITPDGSNLYVQDMGYRSDVDGCTEMWPYDRRIRKVSLGANMLQTVIFDACLACPPNSMSVGGDVTSCSCVQGHYRAESGECVPCALGSESPGGDLSRCTCVEGYYHDPDTGDCVLCGVNQTSSAETNGAVTGYAACQWNCVDNFHVATLTTVTPNPLGPEGTRNSDIELTRGGDRHITFAGGDNNNYYYAKSDKILRYNFQDDQIYDFYSFNGKYVYAFCGSPTDANIFLVGLSDVYPQYKYCVLNVEQQSCTTLATVPSSNSVDDCVFTADGSTVVYTQQFNGDQYSGTYGICEQPVDGTGTEICVSTDGSDDVGLDVTPDGSYIIATTVDTAYSQVQWKITRGDTLSKVLLSSLSDGKDVAVDAKGEYAYLSRTRDPSSVWKIKIEDGTPIEIIAGQTNPSWFAGIILSPDGTRLMWPSGWHDGVYQLHVISTGFDIVDSYELCQACEPGSESPGGDATSCTCVGGYYRALAPTSLTEGVKTEFTSTGLSNVAGDRAHIAVFTTGPYLGKALITGQDTGNTIKMLDLATGTQDTSWVMGSASTASASEPGCSGTSCRFQNINFMCLNHDETKLFVGMTSFGRVINYIDIASKTMINYLHDSSGSLIYFDTFNNAGACAMREAGKLWITRVSYVHQYTSSTYAGAGEYADYANWVHSDTVIAYDVRGFYLSPDSTTMYLGRGQNLQKAVADSNGDFYDTTVVTNSLTVGQIRSLVVSSDQTTAYVGWDSGCTSKIGKVDLASASSSSATGVDLNWVTDVPSAWTLALSEDEQYLYSISSCGGSNWEINSITTGVPLYTYTGPCTSCGENRTSLAADAGLGPAACQWECAADMYVHTEVITPGVVTTAFGTLGAGSGTTTGVTAAADARFNYPQAIAILPGGTKAVVGVQYYQLYLLNLMDNTVEPLAGSSTQGYSDGIGSEAKFSSIQALCSDLTGDDIYVADGYPNGKFRKVNIQSATVTTLFTTTNFDSNSYAYDCAVSSDGFLIYADNYGIHEVEIGNPTSITKTYTAPTKSFKITPDDAFVFYLDKDNHNLYKISRAYANPELIVSGPSTGQRLIISNDGLFVYLTASHAVRKVNIAHKSLVELAGSTTITQIPTTTAGAQDGIGSEALFNNPYHVAVADDDTYLLITDRSNHVIRKVTTGANSGTQSCQACDPGSVSVGGNVTTCTCVGGYYRAAMQVPGTPGVVTTAFGTLGAGSGTTTGVTAAADARFHDPTSIAILPGGIKAVLSVQKYQLYLLDLIANTVEPLAGSSTQGSSDGIGSSAGFWNVLAVCLDPNDANVVYVGDNQKFRKIDIATKEVTTFFTLPSGYTYSCKVSQDGYLIYGDGSTIHEVQISNPGSIAKTYSGEVGRFGLTISEDDTKIYYTNPNDYTIYAITRDGGSSNTIDARAGGRSWLVLSSDQNTIYTTSYNTHSVQKLDLTTDPPTASVLAGTGSTGATDGTGTDAAFHSQYGLDISPDDTFLLVTDHNNHVVRKVTTGASVTTYTGPCTSCDPGYTSLASDANTGGPDICFYECGAGQYTVPEVLGMVDVQIPNPEVLGTKTDWYSNSGEDEAGIGTIVPGTNDVIIHHEKRNHMVKVDYDGNFETLSWLNMCYNDHLCRLHAVTEDLLLIFNRNDGIYQASLSSESYVHVYNGDLFNNYADIAYYDAHTVVWAHTYCVLQKITFVNPLNEPYVSGGSTVSTFPSVYGCNSAHFAPRMSLNGRLWLRYQSYSTYYFREIFPETTTFSNSQSYSGVFSAMSNNVHDWAPISDNYWVGNAGSGSVQIVQNGQVLALFTTGINTYLDWAVAPDGTHVIGFKVGGGSPQVAIRVSLGGFITTQELQVTANATCASCPPNYTSPAKSTSPDQCFYDCPAGGYAGTVDVTTSQTVPYESTEFPEGYTTTIAGTGSSGRNNGVGTAASFYLINGIHLTSDEQYAVLADFDDHCIRKIHLPTSTVSTLAGQCGSAGNVDGTGTSAKFTDPVDIAISPDDTTVYVLERNDKRIRKMTVEDWTVEENGVVTTLATGLATSVKNLEYHPDGYLVVPYNSGDTNLYQTISLTGTVNTVQGTAKPSAGTNWWWLTVTPNGRLIFHLSVDSSVGKIYEYVPSTDTWHTHLDLSSYSPGWYGIEAFDDDTLIMIPYLWQSSWHGVIKVDMTTTPWTVSELAGYSSAGYADSPGTVQFNQVESVGIGSHFILVWDSGNKRLRRVSMAGTITTTVTTPHDTCLTCPALYTSPALSTNANQCFYACDAGGYAGTAEVTNTVPNDPEGYTTTISGFSNYYKRIAVMNGGTHAVIWDDHDGDYIGDFFWYDIQAKTYQPMTTANPSEWNLLNYAFQVFEPSSGLMCGKDSSFYIMITNCWTESGGTGVNQVCIYKGDVNGLTVTLTRVVTQTDQINDDYPEQPLYMGGCVVTNDNRLVYVQGNYNGVYQNKFIEIDLTTYTLVKTYEQNLWSSNDYNYLSSASLSLSEDFNSIYYHVYSTKKIYKIDRTTDVTSEVVDLTSLGGIISMNIHGNDLLYMGTKQSIYTLDLNDVSNINLFAGAGDSPSSSWPTTSGTDGSDPTFNRPSNLKIAAQDLLQADYSPLYAFRQTSLGGSYVTTTTHDTCLTCPTGQTSPALSQSVEDCGCPGGTYEDAETCTSCPSGSTSSLGTTSVTDCECEPGFTGTITSTSDTCDACADGKYKASVGSADCIFCNTVGNEWTTPSSDHTKCYCNVGHYRLTADATDCVVCPTGTFEDHVNNDLACQNCRPSSSTESTASGTADLCLCIPGYFNDPTGSATAACEACNEGFYRETYANQQSCLQCPDHSTTVAAGAFELADCVCQIGHTRSGGDTCVPCDENFYKSSTGNQACTGCNTGATSPAGSTASSQCECTVSGYTGNPGAECVCDLGHTGDPCAPCAENTYKDETGPAGCSVCNLNAVSLAGSTNSTACQCDVGYHGQNGGLCTECDANHYKDSVGEASCSECPNNTHSLPASDSIDDCLADAGYHGFGSSVSACPPNSHSDSESTQFTDCKCNQGYTGPDGG
ncbi:MAG: hypothetical protein CMM02_07665, partial [Rhodopirellula sp.]|nr:hypothetical protein [Rhodopirellula sp.]